MVQQIYSHNTARHAGGGASSDIVTTDGPITALGDLIVITAVRFKDPGGSDFPASSVTGFTLEAHVDPTGADAGVVDYHMKYADASDVTGLPKSYSIDWGHIAPFGKIIGITLIKNALKPTDPEASSAHFNASSAVIPASGSAPTVDIYLTTLTSNEGYDLSGVVPGVLLDWTTSGVVRNAGFFYDDGNSTTPQGVAPEIINFGVNNTGTVATIIIPPGIAPTGNTDGDAGVASVLVSSNDVVGSDAVAIDGAIETGKFRPRQNQAATLGQVMRRVEAIERRASVSTYEQQYPMIGPGDPYELDHPEGQTRAIFSTFFPLGPPTSILSMRVPLFIEIPNNELEVYLRWRSTNERTVAVSAVSVTDPLGLGAFKKSIIFHWRYFTAEASYLDVMVKRVAVATSGFQDPTTIGPVEVTMHTTLPTATIDGVYGLALTSDQRIVTDVNDNPIDPNVP